MLKHDTIEQNATLLLILSLVVVTIGGLVQITPLFYLQNTIEKVEGMRPYSPLEIAGRNIYIREGCYLCHSQMIRPFRDEVERYGHYSLAAELMFDHPFQWGSKRTGPDLARVGGKYSDEWQREHLVDPRSVVPESVMPGYKFLADRDLALEGIGDHLRALNDTVNNGLGAMYSADQIANAEGDLRAQATGIDADKMLDRYKKSAARDYDGDPTRITEMDALVAYLQVLGTMVDFSTFTPEAETQSR